jgi:hypothetical protein
MATEKKLAARGFKDSTLVRHCDETPELYETFISLFEALKLLEEQVGKKDFYLKPDAQNQAYIIGSCYSKQKTPSQKIKLGSFLAAIGFAKVSKDFYRKLSAACPTLLSYDRELDKTVSS